MEFSENALMHNFTCLVLWVSGILGWDPRWFWEKLLSCGLQNQATIQGDVCVGRSGGRAEVCAR